MSRSKTLWADTLQIHWVHPFDRDLTSRGDDPGRLSRRSESANQDDWRKSPKIRAEVRHCVDRHQGSGLARVVGPQFNTLPVAMFFPAESPLRKES